MEFLSSLKVDDFIGDSGYVDIPWLRFPTAHYYVKLLWTSVFEFCDSDEFTTNVVGNKLLCMCLSESYCLRGQRHGYRRVGNSQSHEYRCVLSL